MGTRFEFASQAVMDYRVNAIFEDLSLRCWRDQELDVHESALDSLLEKLGFIFDFFASASTPRGMAMRVWCVLYAVRPDLINHETIQVAADRFEVSQQRLCEVLALMKKQTGISYRSKTGMSDATSQRKAIDAMSAARSAKAARFAKREVLTS